MSGPNGVGSAPPMAPTPASPAGSRPGRGLVARTRADSASKETLSPLEILKRENELLRQTIEATGACVNPAPPFDRRRGTAPPLIWRCGAPRQGLSRGGGEAGQRRRARRAAARPPAPPTRFAAEGCAQAVSWSVLPGSCAPNCSWLGCYPKLLPSVLGPLGPSAMASSPPRMQGPSTPLCHASHARRCPPLQTPRHGASAAPHPGHSVQQQQHGQHGQHVAGAAAGAASRRPPARLPGPQSQTLGSWRRG